MDELAELIVSSHARWMPRVVEAIFGTTDPVSVAEELTEAVAAALAVPVAAAQFYEPGVGSSSASRWPMVERSSRRCTARR